MAQNDAEMPPAPGIGDDLKQISSHIANLREDLETLAGDIGRVGHHQFDRMQNTLEAATAQCAESVRRNPLQAMAVAVGVGFLYGIFTRR